MKQTEGGLADLLQADDDRLIKAWLGGMQTGPYSDNGRSSDLNWEARCRELVGLLRVAARSGTIDPGSSEAAPLRGYFEKLSGELAAKGLSSSETASFVFSLKRPIFERLQEQFAKQPERLVTEIWDASELVDQLALLTVAAYQRSRESIIQRQQDELLELSTPVVKLWDGVLALPMIGTLDSSRTQLAMESLLQRIVETGSEIAILDITGVPTVDTLVAQHLIKTVTAIRLMGADCIISGIRPQIAQTIVHLGIDLDGITTKASLADALALAMRRSGFVVTRPRPQA